MSRQQIYFIAIIMKAYVDLQEEPLIRPAYRSHDYDVRYSKDKVTIVDTPKDQELRFDCLAKNPNKTYKPITMTRTVTAGMHVSPFLVYEYEERFALNFGFYMVRFRPHDVVFFDGEEYSVSALDLCFLDKEKVPDTFHDAVDKHNKKVGKIISHTQKKESEK